MFKAFRPIDLVANIGLSLKVTVTLENLRSRVNKVELRSSVIVRIKAAWKAVNMDLRKPVHVRGVRCWTSPSKSSIAPVHCKIASDS